MLDALAALRLFYFKAQNSVSAYAKTLMAKGKKPNTAAGVEVTKSL